MLCPRLVAQGGARAGRPLGVSPESPRPRRGPRRRPEPPWRCFRQALGPARFPGIGLTLAAKRERMPVPQPTSSTTLPLKRNSFWSIEFMYVLVRTWSFSISSWMPARGSISDGRCARSRSQDPESPESEAHRSGSTSRSSSPCSSDPRSRWPYWRARQVPAGGARERGREGLPERRGGWGGQATGRTEPVSIASPMLSSFSGC